MKILFVSSEGLPFSKTGGLADVVEALPKALVELGHEVAVVLPRYRGTKAAKVVLPSVTIPLGDRLRFPAIADGTTVNGVRYFFVDDPEYFDRPALYGRPHSNKTSCALYRGPNSVDNNAAQAHCRTGCLSHADAAYHARARGARTCCSFVNFVR